MPLILYHVKCLFEDSRSLFHECCQRYCIDRSRCNCKRTRSAGGRRRQGHVKCAELVSRCTLIRLLCTVIGCDIRSFTRLAEQMEANRRWRSCTEFSLVLGRQLATTSFSLTNKRGPLFSLDAETLRVPYDSQRLDIDSILWSLYLIARSDKKLKYFFKSSDLIKDKLLS